MVSGRLNLNAAHTLGVRPLTAAGAGCSVAMNRAKYRAISHISRLEAMLRHVPSASAMGLAPVSATWILNLRGLPGTLERLRIDRQLEEAVTAGADPLHLAAVVGFSEGTAIRWATNARELIGDHHADRLPELP